MGCLGNAVVDIVKPPVNFTGRLEISKLTYTMINEKKMDDILKQDVDLLHTLTRFMPKGCIKWSRNTYIGEEGTQGVSGSDSWCLDRRGSHPYRCYSSTMSPQDQSLREHCDAHDPPTLIQNATASQPPHHCGSWPANVPWIVKRNGNESRADGKKGHKGKS
ncbi:hypothetical protein Vadar_008392 [Vaccinium darrowii]|uniref:Uncharacterized protein n=1 Tax=Vaccinium darrowii TaxID=229202 RepID=A0ACB7YCU6_9ERIC|nr:hypothetical protein Vadar_008392 [Vaccinium darrowii]